MELEKIRRFIPHFKMDDFRYFNKIKSLCFETKKDFSTGEECKNVILVLENSEYQIELSCIDTKYLRFQDIETIECFYITPIENQGYEIGEKENDMFKLYCHFVEVKRCEKL